MAFLFRNARAWGSRMREVTLLVKGPNRSYCLKVPDDIAMEQLRAKVEAKPWTEPVTAAHMFETIWPGTTTPATIADTEDLHFLFESCEKEKIKVVELALKSPPPTASPGDSRKKPNPPDVPPPSDPDKFATKFTASSQGQEDSKDQADASVGADDGDGGGGAGRDEAREQVDGKAKKKKKSVTLPFEEDFEEDMEEDLDESPFDSRKVHYPPVKKKSHKLAEKAGAKHPGAEEEEADEPRKKRKKKHEAVKSLSIEDILHALSSYDLRRTSGFKSDASVQPPVPGRSEEEILAGQKARNKALYQDLVNKHGDGAQFCKAVERMFEENGLKIPSKWEDFNGRTFELTKDKLDLLRKLIVKFRGDDVQVTSLFQLQPEAADLCCRAFLRCTTLELYDALTRASKKDASLRELLTYPKIRLSSSDRVVIWRMYKECHGDLSRMDLLDAVEQVAVVGMTLVHLRRQFSIRRIELFRSHTCVHENTSMPGRLLTKEQIEAGVRAGMKVEEDPWAHQQEQCCRCGGQTPAKGFIACSYCYNLLCLGKKTCAVISKEPEEEWICPLCADIYESLLPSAEGAAAEEEDWEGGQEEGSEGGQEEGSEEGEGREEEEEEEDLEEESGADEDGAENEIEQKRVGGGGGSSSSSSKTNSKKQLSQHGAASMRGSGRRDDEGDISESELES